MAYGSEPQAWHCRPFTQAATSGLELLYQYEVECHVINEATGPRIHWDYTREPGHIQGNDKFGFNEPLPPSIYSFATSIDIQAPPGYVLQIQPHPRFFTDTTGTVPLAISGRLSSEWWPSKIFIPFKLPPRGARHIFRKDEPYAQIILLRPDSRIHLQRMDAAQEARRRDLEAKIDFARTQIARNVWLNPRGARFADHYKVLERAFHTQGIAGVEAVVDAAVERQKKLVPPGLTFTEYMNLAADYRLAGKHVDALAVYFFLRTGEHANSAEVAHGLGSAAAELGLFELAIGPLSAAVAMVPTSTAYRAQLGTVLLELGRYSEAEIHLSKALEMEPNNQRVRSNLNRVHAAKKNGSPFPNR